MMRLLGRERCAPVAQAFFADLCQSPQRRLGPLVLVIDVGIARPVESAGLGHASPERVAVSADVLGECVDDEARTDALGPEEIR